MRNGINVMEYIFFFIFLFDWKCDKNDSIAFTLVYIQLSFPVIFEIARISEIVTFKGKISQGFWPFVVKMVRQHLNYN